MTGIYIHIPYCVRKCRYCDFVSFPDDGGLERYCDALCKEIRLTAFQLPCTEPIGTVFFGGGTPSLLSGPQMYRIMDTIRENFCVCQDVECSMECNPGTATQERMKEYHECGINRLSIGLQSANDQILRAIGRIHTYQQFLETFSYARQVGFSNINVDVMHGLPSQTQCQYLDTLKRVCDLECEHVSAYSLILESGTPLYNEVQIGKTALPDEDAVADMEDAGIAFLQQHGYDRYEISNFSKAGYACRHNLNYWQNGKYYGFGLAAHSAKRIDNEWTRWSNVTEFSAYYELLQGDRLPTLDKDVILKDEEMFETLMVGLRMVQGVDKTSFFARFGISPLAAYPTAFEKLAALNWLRDDGIHIALNDRGLDFQNAALQLFMP